MRAIRGKLERGKRGRAAAEVTVTVTAKTEVVVGCQCRCHRVFFAVGRAPAILLSLFVLRWGLGITFYPVFDSDAFPRYKRGPISGN